jgi:hypothetical protein
MSLLLTPIALREVEFRNRAWVSRDPSRRLRAAAELSVESGAWPSQYLRARPRPSAPAR